MTGLQVGLAGARGTCCWCGRELHDGHGVIAYVYRPAAHDEWNHSRVYCRECNGGRIETQTLGAAEVVATAFLGVMQIAASQTTRLVPTGVELEEYSGPDDGTDAQQTKARNRYFIAILSLSVSDFGGTGRETVRISLTNGAVFEQRFHWLAGVKTRPTTNQ